jgi:hypothetical protein
MIPKYKMTEPRQIFFAFEAAMAISDFRDDPSKLRQWLAALRFLGPKLHPGHVTCHKLPVTTQDIEDWVTHLKDHGGYVYLWELISVRCAIEAFPVFSIRYKFAAERLVIEKREALGRGDTYTDCRLSWDSFNVTDAQLAEKWFSLNPQHEYKATSISDMSYKLKPFLCKEKIWPEASNHLHSQLKCANHLQTAGLCLYSYDYKRSGSFSLRGRNYSSEHGWWQGRVGPPQVNKWDGKHLNPFYIQNLLRSSEIMHGQANIASVIARLPDVAKYNTSSVETVKPYLWEYDNGKRQIWTDQVEYSWTDLTSRTMP